jgi:hypothetical protein
MDFVEALNLILCVHTKILLSMIAMKSEILHKLCAHN